MDNKTPVLYIMVGLPGSGKSTWVGRKQLNDCGETIIVSGDAIRSMLHAGKYIYDEKIEPMVLEIMIDSMRCAFRSGYSVIVDDANITRKHRSKIIDVGTIYAKKIVIAWAPTEKDQCIVNRAKDLRGYSLEHWTRVISDMCERFEPPRKTDDTAIDEIIVI